MDNHRPPGLLYRELRDETIELQSPGLRLESTRPNGRQPSWAQTGATMVDRGPPSLNDWQPIVRLEDRSIAGFEALARWDCCSTRRHRRSMPRARERVGS
jgi:hypothetical protein